MKVPSTKLVIGIGFPTAHHVSTVDFSWWFKTIVRITSTNHPTKSRVNSCLISIPKIACVKTDVLIFGTSKSYKYDLSLYKYEFNSIHMGHINGKLSNFFSILNVTHGAAKSPRTGRRWLRLVVSSAWAFLVTPLAMPQKMVGEVHTLWQNNIAGWIIPMFNRTKHLQRFHFTMLAMLFYWSAPFSEIIMCWHDAKTQAKSSFLEDVECALAQHWVLHHLLWADLGCLVVLLPLM